MKVIRLRLGKVVIAGVILLWGTLALGSSDGSGVTAK